MIQSRALSALLPLLFLGLAASCEFHKDAASLTPPSGTGRVLGYNSLRARILAPKCLGCHSGATPAGGVGLETYAEAFASLDAIHQEVVVEMSMPRSGPLPEDEQELIRRWFLAGGPEEDQEVPAAAITFAQVRDRVLAPNCIRCHGQAGGVNLESYENVLTHLDRIEQVALLDKTMPPSGPLGDEELTLLRTWIDQGKRP